ncbi:neuroendocrine protein 7B2 [Tetranychus urticae]|uniref:Neuroendocrine protein 7B2 n=1 Tax=Tetranychus urticae TaxID=32264 RepID=T1KWY2_TETUR|nr:neuroendocrine protein 7B2 [Tetranychus urticae]
MLFRFLIVPLAILPLAYGYGKLIQIGDGLLQELYNRYGSNVKDDLYETDFDKQGSLNINNDEGTLSKIPRAKFQTRMDDILLGREPSLRDAEYLEHSSLFGHKYVQGGAGEGRQLLKPDGSVENYQVIKSDTILPAYCDPPNPCPIGYTTDDGCLESFENSASFSRDYQSSQKCMCDREHMFDCSGNTEENQLDALARSIQNEVISDSDLDDLVDRMQEGHKVVAKKFHASKKRNPDYLLGEKLPIVAKKAPHLAKN